MEADAAQPTWIPLATLTPPDPGWACFTAGGEYLLWFDFATGGTQLWRRSAGRYQVVPTDLPLIAHACGMANGRDFYLGLLRYDWRLRRFNVDDRDSHPFGDEPVHKNTPSTMRVSPNGRYLATASYDGSAAVSAVTDQKLLWKEDVLPEDVDVRDKRLLVARRMSIELRAISDGRVLHEVKADIPNKCRFITDDLAVFADGWTKNPKGYLLHLWDLKSGRVRPLTDEVGCVTRYSDTSCIVGLESGDAAYVDLSTRQTTRFGLGHEGRIISVDAASDGTVCISSHDGTISIGTMKIPTKKKG